MQIDPTKEYTILILPMVVFQYFLPANIASFMIAEMLFTGSMSFLGLFLGACVGGIFSTLFILFMRFYIGRQVMMGNGAPMPFVLMSFDKGDLKKMEGQNDDPPDDDDLAAA
jgi:hypothetical protein